MDNVTSFKLEGYKFVGAYRVTRCYGGPEEGSWWYNWMEHLASVRVPSTETNQRGIEDTIYEAAAKQLEAEYGSGEGNIYSVNGGYEISIEVEDAPGDQETTRKPSYE